MFRALSITLLATLLATSARGQQTYRLTDSDEWEATSRLDPTSAEGQLAAARHALASEQFERARSLATQWIERYPRHEMIAEAYIIRGDAKAEMGDEYEALFDYEFVARVFPGSEAFVSALERELEIAERYAGGLKRKLWGMRILDASTEAEELFIRIQERLPGSRLAEQAGMQLAGYYFARRELESAAEMYAIFIELYPRSEYASEAKRRLIFSNIATFKSPEHDANGLIEARALLNQLKALEPATAQRVGADAIITRVDESLAQKMLTTARWYIRVNDAVSAEFTLQRMVRKYPTSASANEAIQIVTSLMPSLPPSVQQRARAAGVYPDSVWAGQAAGDQS